ncbi:hypothetical protein Ciccas_003354 [Cichlidogyrus casuarinus]|uniref:Uncharacterized protein n=1 Tax=Cichlidogyrus casuarinus TaxID=1844966 RepID=A0ABD2QEK9_9PLAT
MSQTDLILQSMIRRTDYLFCGPCYQKESLSYHDPIPFTQAVQHHLTQQRKFALDFMLKQFSDQGEGSGSSLKRIRDEAPEADQKRRKVTASGSFVEGFGSQKPRLSPTKPMILTRPIPNPTFLTDLISIKKRVSINLRSPPLIIGSEVPVDLLCYRDSILAPPATCYSQPIRTEHFDSLNIRPIKTHNLNYECVPWNRNKLDTLLEVQTCSSKMSALFRLLSDWIKGSYRPRCIFIIGHRAAFLRLIQNWLKAHWLFGNKCNILDLFSANTEHNYYADTCYVNSWPRGTLGPLIVLIHARQPGFHLQGLRIGPDCRTVVIDTDWRFEVHDALRDKLNNWALNGLTDSGTLHERRFFQTNTPKSSGLIFFHRLVATRNSPEGNLTSTAEQQLLDSSVLRLIHRSAFVMAKKSDPKFTGKSLTNAQFQPSIFMALFAHCLPSTLDSADDSASCISTHSNHADSQLFYLFVTWSSLMELEIKLRDPFKDQPTRALDPKMKQYFLLPNEPRVMLKPSMGEQRKLEQEWEVRQTALEREVEDSLLEKGVIGCEASDLLSYQNSPEELLTWYTKLESNLPESFHDTWNMPCERLVDLPIWKPSCLDQDDPLVWTRSNHMWGYAPTPMSELELPPLATSNGPTGRGRGFVAGHKHLNAMYHQENAAAKRRRVGNVPHRRPDGGIIPSSRGMVPPDAEFSREGPPPPVSISVYLTIMTQSKKKILVPRVSLIRDQATMTKLNRVRRMNFSITGVPSQPPKTAVALLANSQEAQALVLACQSIASVCNMATLYKYIAPPYPVKFHPHASLANQPAPQNQPGNSPGQVNKVPSRYMSDYSYGNPRMDYAILGGAVPTLNVNMGSPLDWSVQEDSALYFAIVRLQDIALDSVWASGGAAVAGGSAIQGSPLSTAASMSALNAAGAGCPLQQVNFRLAEHFLNQYTPVRSYRGVRQCIAALLRMQTVAFTASTLAKKGPLPSSTSMEDNMDPIGLSPGSQSGRKVKNKLKSTYQSAGAHQSSQLGHGTIPLSTTMNASVRNRYRGFTFFDRLYGHTKNATANITLGSSSGTNFGPVSKKTAPTSAPPSNQSSIAMLEQLSDAVLSLDALQASFFKRGSASGLLRRGPSQTVLPRGLNQTAMILTTTGNGKLSAATGSLLQKNQSHMSVLQECNINPDTLMTPAMVLKNKEEREVQQRQEQAAALLAARQQQEIPVPASTAISQSTSYIVASATQSHISIGQVATAPSYISAASVLPPDATVLNVSVTPIVPQPQSASPTFVATSSPPLVGLSSNNRSFVSAPGTVFNQAGQHVYMTPGLSSVAVSSSTAPTVMRFISPHSSKASVMTTAVAQSRLTAVTCSSPTASQTLRRSVATPTIVTPPLTAQTATLYTGPGQGSSAGVRFAPSQQQVVSRATGSYYQGGQQTGTYYITSSSTPSGNASILRARNAPTIRGVTIRAPVGTPVVRTLPSLHQQHYHHQPTILGGSNIRAGTIRGSVSSRVPIRPGAATSFLVATTTIPPSTSVAQVANSVSLRQQQPPKTVQVVGSSRSRKPGTCL